MITRLHLGSLAIAVVLSVLAIGSINDSPSGSGDAASDWPSISEEPRPRAPTASRPPASEIRSDAGDWRTDLPAVLAQLDSGRYSDDQRDALFERDFEGKWFVVEGRVTDVGTWLGQKYVTLSVQGSGLCDVYLPDDFDILSVELGTTGRYVGRFDFLGDGDLFHRQFWEGTRLR